MMSRTELDNHRARLADAAHLPPGEVYEIALQLLRELERSRMREALLRVEQADLAAAARATLAAATDRPDTDALVFLAHEFDAHGRLPTSGESPGRILADAAANRALLTGERVAA